MQRWHAHCMAYPQSENDRYWTRIRIFGGLVCSPLFAWQLFRAVQAESVFGAVLAALLLLGCLTGFVYGVRRLRSERFEREV